MVYGAGPLGSLFAARLHWAGHTVSLLARGQRLADLREYGIVLNDSQTGKTTVERPEIVEHLNPDDAYDLILVIMRKNRALDILPILAANKNSPHILFLMNNAAGPGELVQALGAQRVLVGFPMAAGYRRGHIIYYLCSSSIEKPARIPIGEVDGQITPRLKQVGKILASMEGFDVDLRSDMDAWLKTHVALLMPSLAPAMRAAGSDNIRMAHTRDAIVLAIRAIREGFRVLRSLGYPIIPRSVRIFEQLPEPILVWGFQKRLVDPRMRIAMVEHSRSAKDEIKHLADEFLVLKKQSVVSTPVIDRLYPYFDPATPLLPEGSAELSLDWRFLWVASGLLAVIVVFVCLICSFFE